MNRNQDAPSAGYSILASFDWLRAANAQAEKRSGRFRSRGFTLVELLIVMMIIMVLMGLLLPAISKVRTTAYIAATQQDINRIAAGVQQYYSDFSAYPGMFKNDNLGGASMPTIANITNSQNITETENMELSLFGGLIWNGTTLTFDIGTMKASKGAVSLINSTTYKSYPAYLVAGSNDFMVNDVTSNLATTKFWNPTPNAAGAQDTEIPEVVDGFPGQWAMPIVYLRAKPGALLTCDGPAAGTPSQAQYNYAHLAAYFSTSVPTVTGPSTPWINYFANQTAPVVNTNYQAKNPNGFWLIAPGPPYTPTGTSQQVRAYGTASDICYGFSFN